MKGNTRNAQNLSAESKYGQIKEERGFLRETKRSAEGLEGELAKMRRDTGDIVRRLGKSLQSIPLLMNIVCLRKKGGSEGKTRNVGALMCQMTSPRVQQDPSAHGLKEIKTPLTKNQ